MSAPFAFIDLFAGIGGFRLGFEAVGGQCVFTSEIDPYARKVYAANHGVAEADIAGDITQIAAADIPDHDLLCAGFPCQAFSLAGQRKGFDDTRGTLFFDVARILEHCRPQAFILENVKNLLGHDDGKTFRVIYRTLLDLGYRVSYRIINAAAWVPQKRERIYIVGNLGNPRWSLDFMDVGDPANGPRLGTILEPDWPSSMRLNDATLACIENHTENKGRSAHSIFGADDVGNTLIAEYGGTFGASRMLIDPEARPYTPADCTVPDKGIAGLKRNAKKRGRAFKALKADDVANTLTAKYSGSSGGLAALIDRPKGNPRRLTPRECARLMGYPDTFKIPVSKSRAYHLFGNSVVPPVIEAVAKHIGAPHDTA